MEVDEEGDVVDEGNALFAPALAVRYQAVAYGSSFTAPVEIR